MRDSLSLPAAVGKERTFGFSLNLFNKILSAFNIPGKYSPDPVIAINSSPKVGGDDQNRTGVHGFADRCVATPPRRHLSGRRDSNPRLSPWQGDALARLSYYRIKSILAKSEL